MRYIFFCFSVFVFIFPIYAIDVGGNQSGTWSISDSPVRIIRDVTIPIGQTLIIQPGVTVDFTDSLRLLINGNLIARGTSDSLIIFSQ